MQNMSQSSIPSVCIQVLTILLSFVNSLNLGIEELTLSAGEKDTVIPDDSKFNPRPNWYTEYTEHGSDITLHCSRASLSVIQWRKDGEIIKTREGRVWLEERNQTLRIFDPEVSDSGDYNCSLWNDSQMTDSYGREVTVEKDYHYTHPRLVKWDPLSYIRYTEIGKTAFLSCSFDVGDPSALFQLKDYWILGNGTMLPDNHKYFWNETDHDKVRVLTLTIYNITEDDLRTQYACKAENAYGNSSQLFSLSLKDTEEPFPILTVCIASSAGVVIIVVIISVICVRVRSRRKKEELEWEQPDVEKFDVPGYDIVYDVFVSYSSEDEDWVKGELYTKLEGQGYKVNIDFKDFVPGMAIAENIMDSIYKSKKSIVVMSKNFLKSMWGQFELQQAHNKAITQRKDVLILIKYSKCKVPGKLMGKTFLDWTDPGVQPHFWTRLAEAIGDPGHFKDQADDDRVDQEDHFISLEDHKLIHDQDQNADIIMEQEQDLVPEVKKKFERTTSDYSSGTSDFGESEEVFVDVQSTEVGQSRGEPANIVKCFEHRVISRDNDLSYRSRKSTDSTIGGSCTSETQALLS